MLTSMPEPGPDEACPIRSKPMPSLEFQRHAGFPLIFLIRLGDRNEQGPPSLAPNRVKAEGPAGRGNVLPGGIPVDRGRLLVAEVNWRRLTVAQ